MAIFQSLRRWFGNPGSTGQHEGEQLTEPLTRAHPSAVRVYNVDSALQVSAVWACVELITDNISSLPIFVYEKEDENGNKNLARDSKLWLLLHTSPNRRHTPMEFWQFMVMNYLLRGNAYAKIVRDASGSAIELWPLAADQVIVKVLPDKSIVYEYTYEGQIFVYAEQTIFHWRDKGNGAVGMSRLDFMRSSVDVAVKAQDHAGRTFSKSGKRPGVFMIDKLLTDVQREAIRKNYAGLVEGANDDLLVLELGAKFESLGMSPADIQLLESRRFSVEDIARWFGVPSTLINDTAKTTTWGTGITEMVQGFYKFRLRTILESIEQAIERRIFTPRERELYTVEFSLNGFLRGSLNERLDTGSKAVQNGLLTRNEWRQTENLPKQNGADVLTVQSNLIPLDKLGQVITPGDANNAAQDPTAQ